MSSHFKKNNCIFDSESEDNSSAESEDSQEFTNSLSSVDSTDPENPEHSEFSNSPAKKNSTCDESGFSVSPPTKEKSSFSSNFSYSSALSNDDSKRVSKEGKINDSNTSHLEGQSNKKAASDILAFDSSLSVGNVTECVIEDSFNENMTQMPYKTGDASKNRIIVESSDSDASLELINSMENETGFHSQKSGNIPKRSETIISSDEGSIIQETSRTDSFIKSSSKVSTASDNSLSKSGLSNVSQTSVHSNSSIDDRRALEQQLCNKRTAYQNLLRAVKTCNPKKLKDGGKLLEEKLFKCQEEIDELKKKLQSLKNDPDVGFVEKPSAKSNILFSTSDQVTNNLGKKGLETHRVEQALTVDALVTIHESLQTCPAEDAFEEAPKGLKVELMPHQKYGLSWLLWREKQIPPGGILADDMGLGKTLTMIALVLRAEEYKRKENFEEDKTPVIINDVKMYPGKTLVICPSSLLGQWEGQIKQHCKPYLLSSLIHHGKPRELQAKKLAVIDLVITSYGVVVEENKIIKGDKKGPLFRVNWERIIIDEGHIIKNHKTKTAQAVCELEGKHRWCLTGTPVHNRELDMFSLLKFLRCSPFDSLSVWKRWVDNKSANGLLRLNTVVKSILLRRTKEELKTLGELEDLPSKKLITFNITLDEEEQKVYHEVLHFSKTLLAEFILQEQKKQGFVNDELRNRHHEMLRSANEIKSSEIFVLLLRLRQICCLPGLIHSMLEKDSCAEVGIDPEDDPILKDLTSQIKRISIGTNKHIAEEWEKKEKILTESNPVFQINRASGKIKAVLNIIEEGLKAEDKIVVVSQWANLLHKLKAHILPLNVGVVSLDGSVPVKLRPKIIEDFNRKDSDVKIMLLSLTAGGVGLNLIGGNRLVIFEPHWNPQLESQACDRIYRVGQKKKVYIYKLICKHTIEEKIELLQKKKLELANNVLKGELKTNRSQLTLADLKILFDMHS